MFSDPLKNLRAFGLREDSIVADLGAGTGYYTIAASPMVRMGRVYAVDIEKDFLTTIKNKVKDGDINNVEILWGNVEKHGGTQIGDSLVDAVIASNILFQVEDKHKFIEEIKRILKPKGRVLLVDWLLGSGENFPKIKGSLSKDVAHELFTNKGFVLDRHIDTGPHHYGMILIKN